MARIFSGVYFGFFLLLPIFSSIEITKPVPARLTEPVLPLSKREGMQWRLIEEGLRAAQYAPAYLKLKEFLSDMRRKITGN